MFIVYKCMIGLERSLSDSWIKLVCWVYVNPLCQMYFPVLRHHLFAFFPFFVIDMKGNKQVEVLCCNAFYNVTVMHLNSMMWEEQNKKYRITTWVGMSSVFLWRYSTHFINFISSFQTAHLRSWLVLTYWQQVNVSPGILFRHFKCSFTNRGKRRNKAAEGLNVVVKAEAGMCPLFLCPFVGHDGCVGWMW